MNDMDPILLLLVGLIAIALGILWVFSIFVAVRIARQRGLRAWPWGLGAFAVGLFPAGTICLGAGYMAHSYRRSILRWAAVQLGALAAVAAGAAVLMIHTRVMGWSPVTDLLLLLGFCAASLGPLWIMAIVGPVPSFRTEDDKHLIRASKLHKYYYMGKRNIHVLRGVSLSVARGEFVAILGASGCGKSTLLHMLGLLDRPDSGEVFLDGVGGSRLSGPQADRIRCHDIGFVFQFYHLLPELNVLENVLLPARVSAGTMAWPGMAGAARERAKKLLHTLGLSSRLKHRPRELSGGEQQRVAIARALINEPRILLADEPTGNLDSHTGARIIKLLKKLNQETGQTVVMVTHDQALAGLANRVLHLRDGKLQ